MSSWVQRLRGGHDRDDPEKKEDEQVVRGSQGRRRRSSHRTPPKDVNIPKKRLQIHQRCLYERTLPGDAFISAHVNRLQHGYYESTSLHEDDLDNLYFVSVHFVFHPHDPRSHRFKSADIRVCVHGDEDSAAKAPRSPPLTSHPRILKHAPELMFGAVSPEDLQWNFSLSSSLGVSQAPVSATLNPSGGMKSSYQVFDMMSIQGSIRTNRSPRGPAFDVEDGMAVWTLEENLLQRSGLPREFDFVLLIHKPEDVKNVYMTVDVDADVESWFGTYPRWYTDLSKYMPIQDYILDFGTDIGQKFHPNTPGRGFNFASLPRPLEDYVAMPGTVYPTSGADNDDEQRDRHCHHHDYGDFGESKALQRSPSAVQKKPDFIDPTNDNGMSRRVQGSDTGRFSWAPENVSVRVVLEHQFPQYSPNPRRFSYSPLSTQEPVRQPSIRRRKSRTGLKEYGAKQALQDLAHDVLNEGSIETGSVTKTNSQ